MRSRSDIPRESSLALRRRRRRRVAARRSGAAAVEFALVCPVLILFALACADFGRIAHYYEVVANSARTGAERGAAQQFTDHTRAAWEAAVQAAVVDELESLPDFDPADMEFSLTTTTDADGMARVAVEVAYPFRMAVSWPGLPTETQLRKRIEYRQFR